MWIDLARGLPFWSTLVVQPDPSSDSEPRYVIVDGERRYRALRRLQANLERELQSDEWTAEEKEAIRTTVASRAAVPCRLVSVEGAERQGLQFRANKSLALNTGELKRVYQSLFEEYFRRSRGRPYTPKEKLTAAESSKLWRAVARETGERTSKVTAIGSLDDFELSGPNCAELARRALLERNDPDAKDFSWIEEVNSLFQRDDWDAIAAKVLAGEITSVATKGGLRDYAKAIYSVSEHGDQRTHDLAREGLLKKAGFKPLHADALSYLGGEIVAKQGPELLNLLAGTSAAEAKVLARTLIQRSDATIDTREPTTEDYHDDLVALLYKTGEKLDPQFASYVPDGMRLRQLIQTLGALQIKLNQFMEAMAQRASSARPTRQLPSSQKRLDG